MAISGENSDGEDEELVDLDLRAEESTAPAQPQAGRNQVQVDLIKSTT